MTSVFSFDSKLTCVEFHRHACLMQLRQWAMLVSSAQTTVSDSSCSSWTFHFSPNKRRRLLFFPCASFGWRWWRRRISRFFSKNYTKTCVRGSCKQKFPKQCLLIIFKTYTISPPPLSGEEKISTRYFFRYIYVGPADWCIGAGKIFRTQLLEGKFLCW